MRCFDNISLKIKLVRAPPLKINFQLSRSSQWSRRRRGHSNGFLMMELEKVVKFTNFGSEKNGLSTASPYFIRISDVLNSV